MLNYGYLKKLNVGDVLVAVGTRYGDFTIGDEYPVYCHGELSVYTDMGFKVSLDSLRGADELCETFTLKDRFKVGDKVVQVEATQIKAPAFDRYNYPADEYPVLTVGSTDGGLVFKDVQKGGSVAPERFRLCTAEEIQAATELALVYGHPVAENASSTKAADHKDGMKFDDGKIDMRLLTRDLAKPLFLVSTVLTYGKIKYEESGWKSVQKERYESALDRHLTAWRTGEQQDPETGIHHLAHVACNVLFLLWHEVKDTDLSELAKFNQPPKR